MVKYNFNVIKFIFYNILFPIFYSDPAMKQFLLHLDEKLVFGRKFVFQDLDETHLFISSDIVDVLQAKFDDMMDQISFPVHERGN